MESESSTPPGKSPAVTVVGILTIIWGGAYSLFGGMLAFAGDDFIKNLAPDDPVGGMAPILKMLAAVMIAIGVIWLLQGIPAIIAGCGVLKRKQWGRVLTFLVALLASLWSLFPIYAGDTTSVAIGIAQLLYGLLTFIILIVKSDEFSLPGK